MLPPFLSHYKICLIRRVQNTMCEPILSDLVRHRSNRTQRIRGIWVCEWLAQELVCYMKWETKRCWGQKNSEQYKLCDNIFYLMNRKLWKWKEASYLTTILLHHQVRWYYGHRKSRAYSHPKHKVCPEGIQPRTMTNRDISRRRYKKQETLYTGQWDLSPLHSGHLGTTHSSPNCSTMLPPLLQQKPWDEFGHNTFHAKILHQNLGHGSFWNPQVSL